MKSSEQSLKNAANTIFAKFVVKLASTEPVTAAVITAAAGGLILAAGGYQELADTTTLLTQAGPDALAAYQATTPKTITQILGRALAGDLPSRGLATMGTGIWTVLTAPPVAYAVAKFAKGLYFVKEMAEKVERAERPRGATRLAADLDAIDNHYRQPENKGPSPRGLR